MQHCFQVREATDMMNVRDIYNSASVHINISIFAMKIARRWWNARTLLIPFICIDGRYLCMYVCKSASVWKLVPLRAHSRAYALSFSIRGEEEYFGRPPVANSRALHTRRSVEEVSVFQWKFVLDSFALNRNREQTDQHFIRTPHTLYAADLWSCQFPFHFSLVFNIYQIMTSCNYYV